MAAPLPPGQQPSPQQMAAIQQQIAMEAQRRGMTPQQLQQAQRKEIEDQAKKAGLTFEQYVNKLKQQAYENHVRQQQMAQQEGAQPPGQGQPPQMQGQQGQQVPITPGAPDPRALALAKWLRGQDLKTRTCILNGQRKDMFRGLHLESLSQSLVNTDALKLNELSEQSNPPPTKKLERRTPSSPKSQPPPPKPKSSSSSPSPSSLCVSQNQIPTKDTTTPLQSLRNELKDSGP